MSSEVSEGLEPGNGLRLSRYPQERHVCIVDNEESYPHTPQSPSVTPDAVTLRTLASDLSTGVWHLIVDTGLWITCISVATSCQRPIRWKNHPQTTTIYTVPRRLSTGCMPFPLNMSLIHPTSKNRQSGTLEETAAHGQHGHPGMLSTGLSTLPVDKPSFHGKPRAVRHQIRGTYSSLVPIPVMSDS